jgi:hypothetical protein
MNTKQLTPRSVRPRRPYRSRFISHRSRAFTLVEVLIATVLTLLLMTMVVYVFGKVSVGATETRSLIELSEELRTCKITLQADLANLTARMLPPPRVDEQLGYFEYVEGPMGPVPISPTARATWTIDSIQSIAAGTAVFDSSVGDIDDVLMFTVRSENQPFTGRVRIPVITGNPLPGPQFVQWVDTTVTSQYAEICYFVRGNTLYRRMLLVRGDLSSSTPTNPIGAGIINAESLSSNYDAAPYSAAVPKPFPYLYDISFYDKYDISVRQEGGTYDTTLGANPVPQLRANTLGDLSKRQNRYGHQPHAYPFDTRFWGPLGLPTLRECTFYTDYFNQFAGRTAHWPFPFYEPNPSAIMNIAASEATSLWAFPVATPVASFPNFPYIYPSPNSAASQPYQSYYLNPPAGVQPSLVATATPSTVPAAPGGLPQYINLTQGGNLATTMDCWRIPLYPWDQVSPFNGAIAAFSLSATDTDPINPGQIDLSTRVSDDVILTNVISFDVKAWDPQAPILFGTIPNYPTPTTYLPGDGVNVVNIGGTNFPVAGANYLAALQAVGTTTTIVGQGAYVDLNYQQLINNLYPTPFSGPGNTTSTLQFVYDTGCFDYEDDGLDQDGLFGPDQYTNGFDDNLIGGVDDITELEGPIPYPFPLKGIQIKIRVFEPDSRQIREITVVEDFLWE